MFAYCHNNPVLYADPSGYVIVLAPDATEEEIEEYERAIAYLQTSETGKKLIERLKESSEVITIVFVDDNNMRYCPYTKRIYFDINSGLVLEDGFSVQSAALGLAHEMGHAAQDLDCDFFLLLASKKAEPLNLETYEMPIAKELGEPIRTDYLATIGFMNMKNSTHFRTISTSPAPWWYNWLPWNWGKPYVINHNVGE